jgi:hypothetical protein
LWQKSIPFPGGSWEMMRGDATDFYGAGVTKVGAGLSRRADADWLECRVSTE